MKEELLRSSIGKMLLRPERNVGKICKTWMMAKLYAYIWRFHEAEKMLVSIVGL
jgi:hypothetical protein